LFHASKPLLDTTRAIEILETLFEKKAVVSVNVDILK
jgi:hypothetical protein